MSSISSLNGNYLTCIQCYTVSDKYKIFPCGHLLCYPCYKPREGHILIDCCVHKKAYNTTDLRDFDSSQVDNNSKIDKMYETVKLKYKEKAEWLHEFKGKFQRLLDKKETNCDKIKAAIKEEMQSMRNELDKHEKKSLQNITDHVHKCSREMQEIKEATNNVDAQIMNIERLYRRINPQPTTANAVAKEEVKVVEMIQLLKTLIDSMSKLHNPNCYTERLQLQPPESSAKFDKLMPKLKLVPHQEDMD